MTLNKINKNMIDPAFVQEVADTATQLADKATQSSLNTLNNIVSDKAPKSYVDTLVASLASGSPKGTYATLSALQTAFPTGNANIYVVTADGKWYYWNGTAWTSGGVYQSSNVAAENVSLNSNMYANSNIKNALEEAKEKFSSRVLKFVNSLHTMEKFNVSSKLDIPVSTINNSLVEFLVKNNGTTTNEINFNGFRSRSKNLFNKATAIKGKYANHTNGQILNEPSQTLSAVIEISPNTDYSFGSAQGIRYGRMVFYDVNDIFISGIVGGISDGYITAKSPVNAVKMRVSVSEALGNIDIWQVEKGIGFTEYQDYVDEYYILETPVKLIGYNNISDTLNHEGVLLKKFGKSLLDGSRTWNIQQETALNYRFYTTASTAVPNSLIQVANSGIGKSADGDFSVASTILDSKGIAMLSNNNLYVTVPKTSVDTFSGATPLDRFKNYLVAKPITLYYQLTTTVKELIKMNYPLAYNGGEFHLLADVSPNADLKLSVRQVSTENEGNQSFVKLEEAGTTHYGGYPYTSFGGGAVVDGKEIFILRNAKQHVTIKGDYGKTVAYIRDKKGNWEKRLLNLGFTVKEFRDINLSLPYDGTRDVILSGCLFDGTNYENWVFRLDKDLNLISSEQIITTFNGYFSWGNYLFSPLGVGLKTAYDTNLVANSRGVRLLRKTGSTYDDSVVLFEGSGLLPTETTIGYWGNKLVAICRQNASFSLYRETTDLEGLTGWSVPKTLEFKAHAPSLQPYTPKNEPLILSFSSISPMISQTPKRHRDISISTTFNGVNWHKEVVITENNHYGGYNSFVKIGAGKYGMIYYDDYDNLTENYKVGTDLYYEQVDVDRYLNDLEWLKHKYISQ